MPQSLAKIVLHIVFSTKHRCPFVEKDIGYRLHAFIAAICRNENARAHRVGGTEDHVHIACELPRTLTVADLVKKVKTKSSIWLKQEWESLSAFQWQGGYAVFSLDISQLATLIKYIDSQQEHHQEISFQKEYLSLLKEAGIQPDSRYVFD